MERADYFDFQEDKQIYIESLFPAVQNSFTYELLVKPEAMHQIDMEAQKGTSGLFGQRYIIGPGHGKNFNEAGIGISIGINGVSIYEHTTNHLPATLVFETTISDWTHIAVVYENRIPHLYINGELVKVGLQSSKATVIASGLFGGLHLHDFFIGKLKYVRLWNQVRTQDQIQGSMYGELTGEEPGLFHCWAYKNMIPTKKSSCVNNAKSAPHPKGILFILNTDGGTAHYQNLYIQKIKDRTVIFKLTFSDGLICIHKLDEQEFSSIRFHVKKLTGEAFRNTLLELGIDLIYVNHLIHLPAFQLMDLIQAASIPYIYFAHDFFCACPSFNLINHYGLYCNSETNIDTCQSCLRQFNSDSSLFGLIRGRSFYCQDDVDIHFQIRNLLEDHVIHIEAWRTRFALFLQGAKAVITPSESAREIIQRYYPNISVTVRRHSLHSAIQHTFEPEFADQPVLTVAFLGYINHNKGYRLLCELKDIIYKEKLPIRIVVIGSTVGDKHPSHENEQFIVTGLYKNERLSLLLAKYKVALVITASVCPETFSYTTHEAPRLKATPS